MFNQETLVKPTSVKDTLLYVSVNDSKKAEEISSIQCLQQNSSRVCGILKVQIHSKKRHNNFKL